MTMIDFEPPATLVATDDLTRRREESAPAVAPAVAHPSPARRRTGGPDGEPPAWLGRSRTVGHSVAARARIIVAAISGMGWAVIAIAVVAWVAAIIFGWEEARVVAAFCLVITVVAALFTIGRISVTMTLGLDPARVSVDQPASARFEMRNSSSRRQSPTRVRLPVGEASAHFIAPALKPGESYDDWVSVPTGARGVVQVGPVYTYREDPLGLIRRQIAWTQPQELIIHPTVVAIGEIGSGWLRDLEGRPTQDVSNSDLAFHTLRDYEPGDDWRYIHWKSSARLSSVSDHPSFMIRQFLDTRKTHLAILSDLDADHFADPAEFELALSCAASVARRAVLDDLDLTVLCGSEVMSRPTSNIALDPYARAELGDYPLAAEFDRIKTQAGDASMVLVVTGSLTEFEQLGRGRVALSYNAAMVALRVSLGAPISLRGNAGFVELTVGSLADLPRALTGGLS